MEYIISRADYRRNKTENRANKIFKIIEKIYKLFGLIIICMLFEIIKISYSGISYERKTIKEKALIDEIKNETNYELKYETVFSDKLIVPCNGIITSRYGLRNSNNPIVSTNHKGIDIGAPKGTEIIASHDGIVIEANHLGTYGKCVMIKNENLITVYAHCSKIDVKEGDFVKQKDKIAEVRYDRKCNGKSSTF